MMTMEDNEFMKITKYLISVIEAAVFVVSWLIVYVMIIPHIQWSFTAVFAIFVMIIASNIDFNLVRRDG